MITRLIAQGIATLIAAAAFGPTASTAETLYNGIVLPETWPPRLSELTREPLATPPYLNTTS